MLTMHDDNNEASVKCNENKAIHITLRDTSQLHLITWGYT